MDEGEREREKERERGGERNRESVSRMSHLSPFLSTLQIDAQGYERESDRERE
jgi:hypothetical protein